MSRSLLNYVGADVPEWMLRGACDVGNGLDCHAIVVKLEGPHPDRQLLMRRQSSEALVGLGHAGRGPSQGHAGILPAFDVARDAANGAHHVLGDLGRSERSTQLRWHLQAEDSQDFWISSRPWRMVAATPGHCWSSRRARLRINFSVLSASSSQAWRSTRHVAA